MSIRRFFNILSNPKTLARARSVGLPQQHKQSIINRSFSFLFYQNLRSQILRNLFVGVRLNRVIEWGRFRRREKVRCFICFYFRLHPLLTLCQQANETNTANGGRLWADTCIPDTMPCTRFRRRRVFGGGGNSFIRTIPRPSLLITGFKKGQ